MILKENIELDKIKEILIDANIRDYFTQTPMFEILKTSTNFEFNIIEQFENCSWKETKGDKVIKVTFTWEGDTHERGFGRDQNWYIDVQKYIGYVTRNVILEKFIDKKKVNEDN